MPKRRPLDGDDIDRLLQNLQTHKEKLIIITLLDTGMRVSELVDLKPNDVYYQRQYILVRGKGGRERRVPITRPVLDLLGHHYALSNTMGFTAQTARDTVKRVAERAGITAKVTPHILRHTFAVEALNKGVDIKSLQVALGHSSITTTEQYLIYTTDRTAKAFSERGWL